MPFARYPRWGQLLAPRTLGPILEVPVPRAVKRFSRIKWKGIRLADLDATSWERFGVRVCQALAGAIIARVIQATASSLAPIHAQRLPRVDRAMSLEELSLEPRTYNSLRRARLHEDVRRLGDLSIGDIRKVRGFGAKCLVDLLVALETVSNAPGPSLPSESAMSWIEWVRASNLPLPANAYEWTFPDLPGSLTLEQLGISAFRCRRLREHGWDDSLSTWSGYPMTRLLEIPGFSILRLRSLLSRLDATLRRLPPEPAAKLEPANLEEEMLHVFLFNPKHKRKPKPTRHRLLFVRFYGLDGQGGASLETLAQAEGTSRQYVSQVCRLRPRPGCSTPRLEAALQAIAELLPAPAVHIEAELVRRGLVSQHVPLSSLAHFARALHLPLLFQLHFSERCYGLWALRPDDPPELITHLERTARRYVKYYGVASLTKIAARVAALTGSSVDPTLTKKVLSALPGFCWVDEATGWFWFRDHPRNYLVRHLRKILAVAERLTVDALCDCIRRLPIPRFRALPPHVLNNFCRSLPGVRLEGDELLADPPLDWRVVLPGRERELVNIFVEHGPLLFREDLKKYARQCGMSDYFLAVLLYRVPTIRRDASGLYDLYGARVRPGVSADGLDLRQPC